MAEKKLGRGEFCYFYVLDEKGCLRLFDLKSKNCYITENKSKDPQELEASMTIVVFALCKQQYAQGAVISCKGQPPKRINLSEFEKPLAEKNIKLHRICDLTRR